MISKVSAALCLSLCLFAAASVRGAESIGISSIEELQKIGNEPGYSLDGDYYLTQDIDASATEGWNGGTGFDPIGPDYDNPFTGTFDGRGHVISDLHINRPDENDVGLFGYIGWGAVVLNLGLEGGSVTGNWFVGGLSGQNESTVLGCYATGALNGERFVGGLVGGNLGTVSQCYATGAVRGKSSVGGLVGWNLVTVQVSLATGNVFGEQDLGGLVGNNASKVYECFATGAVTGSTNVGGLVGLNHPGTVSESHATGAAAGNEHVGGLVGNNHGKVLGCSATGELSGNERVGGLVGVNQAPGKISGSHATGNVNGDYVGGLVGWNGGTVLVSHATGDVTGVQDVGGLAGRNHFGSTVSGCYATGAVSGARNVGGLVGFVYWDGTVSGSHATGAVSGENSVGGLVGYIWAGSISGSYATGAVTGDKHIGGLVGFNIGTISESYAAGPIIGLGVVGGLVGIIAEGSTVSEGYATGKVSGNVQVGGLVGRNRGTVSDCYATGAVNGEQEVGGLVGSNDGTVSESHWDTQTSGQEMSDGGEGRTTAQMTYPHKAGTTYVGWDFENVWAEDSDYSRNDGYPYLRAVSPCAVPTWTLTVLEPDGQGTTEPGVGEHAYNVGLDAEVTASPTDGWALHHWLLDGQNAGDNNPIVIPSGTAGQTKELQAVFAEEDVPVPMWALNILEPEGEGTTEPDMGLHEYPSGQDAGVAAYPAEGWQLDHWLLDGEHFGDSENPTVPSGAVGQTKVLQPIFTPISITLYVGKSASQEAVNPGGGIAFVIAYGNYGPTDASGVVVRETLPINAEYVQDSATDGGIYDPATRTIAWHVGELAAGTLGRTIGFHVVVDDALEPGDSIINDEYSIESDDTAPVFGEPVNVEVVDDADPPTASLLSPGPSHVFAGYADLQASRGVLVAVEVADGGSGVDLQSVLIRVDGELVYDGAEETGDGEYESAFGTVRRAGAAEAYRFYFFRSEPFAHGQDVSVQVEAADRAGNAMEPAEFAFRTHDRIFWRPFRANDVFGNCGPASLASDPAGNLFAAWTQAGQVFASTRPEGADDWAESVLMGEGAATDSAPAVAGDNGAFLVAWADAQENVRVAIFEGGELAGGPFQMNQDGPAVAPAALVHFPNVGESRPYVAWQEQRDGAWDVFVASYWQDEWHVQRVTDHPADQTLPALAADGEAVYVVWTDSRNGAARTDIYGAWSGDSWLVNPVLVDDASSQSSPTLAVGSRSEGPVFHLAWEDDRNGVQDVYHASGGSWPLDAAAAANVVADEDSAVLAAPQMRPAIHVFGDSVFIALQDGRHGRWGEGEAAIHFAEKHGEDGGFGLDVLVKPTPLAQTWPTLASDAWGNPVALWLEGSGADANVVGAGALGFRLLGSADATPGLGVEIAPGQYAPGSPGLAVPPGAVEVGVELKVKAVDNPPALAHGAGKPWKFGPAGLTFSVPATIEFPVSPEDLEGLVPPWRAFRYDKEMDAWTEEGITDVEHDPAAGVIRFKTGSLSIFQAARTESVVPPGAIYDLDGDGVIGPGDYEIFIAAWRSRPGDLHWNPAADFTGDGFVGVADYAFFTAAFGKQADDPSIVVPE